VYIDKSLPSTGSVAMPLIGFVKYISMALKIGGSIAFFVATIAMLYFASAGIVPEKESANRNHGVYGCVFHVSLLTMISYCLSALLGTFSNSAK
jgi:hypothetical protein